MISTRRGRDTDTAFCTNPACPQYGQAQNVVGTWTGDGWYDPNVFEADYECSECYGTLETDPILEDTRRDALLEAISYARPDIDGDDLEDLDTDALTVILGGHNVADVIPVAAL